MISLAPSYHGYRFPPDIIAHAVWLYFRFSLSFRDVEDLLGPAGHYGHLGDDPPVVSHVRPRVCPWTPAPARTPRGHVVSR